MMRGKLMKRCLRIVLTKFIKTNAIYRKKILIWNLKSKLWAFYNHKNRFGIIGNFPHNRYYWKSNSGGAIQIFPFWLSENLVLVKNISESIHSESRRKHQPYIVVNCGTIQKEHRFLGTFGHEERAFGDYFEDYLKWRMVERFSWMKLRIAVCRLKVRLLRVLESGDLWSGFFSGSKTNVRIVLRLMNMMKAIDRGGRFREDLYYRLSTVQIDLRLWGEKRRYSLLSENLPFGLGHCRMQVFGDGWHSLNI